MGKEILRFAQDDSTDFGCETSCAALRMTVSTLVGTLHE